MVTESHSVAVGKIFECKIINIFLSIRLNICLWCSKEPSHRDGSFEYPQPMFWLWTWEIRKLFFITISYREACKIFSSVFSTRVNWISFCCCGEIFECKSVKNFLSISSNIFRWSKEPSHWDGSFEYPQHMFMMFLFFSREIRKLLFPLHTPI